jgi:hypothetical protein
MPVPDLILTWSSSAEVYGVAFSSLSGCFSSDTGIDEEVALAISGATIGT